MRHKRDPSQGRELVAVAGLAVVTLALFWPAGDCQFVNFDDPHYVTANPNVLGGLSASGAWWALTSFDHSNWHPLTWLSLQLDAQVYGTRGLNAHGFLVTNVLLHTANVLLLYWVWRRMTGAVAASALLAALFAVHPLHVESVCWVSERKDVLSTLFWLLTMGAYLRYAERPSVGRYLGVALALALGLAAKPMLVTLPFALLLLDYWPLRRFAPGDPSRLRVLLLEKVPLLALAGVSCVLTLIAQGRGGTVHTFEEVPLSDRLANAAAAYATYLGQTVWPRGLAVYYPYAHLTWSDWRVWGACLLLAGITATVARQATRRPYLLVGWLWYLGTLVPVIGLVQVGGQAHADRYTYVPSIGLFLIAAWSAAELARRARRLALGGGAAVLVGCACVTWVQVAYWHDNFTLWRHTLAVTGPNAVAHDGLGLAYREAGQLGWAKEEFRRAVEIEPRDTNSRGRLGLALLGLNRRGEARDQFRHILELDPDDNRAHFELGVIASLEGDPAEAVARFTEVVRLQPEDVRAYVNLAIELSKQGHYEESRRRLLEAERRDPRLRGTPVFEAARKAAQGASSRP